MTVNTFDFQECMTMSDGVDAGADVRRIMTKNVSGVLNVFRAHKINDKSGIDWWAEHSSGKMIAVDLKVNRVEWKSRDGRTCLPLETWSNVERRHLGWTLRPEKKTDYVLWTFQDTGRWCLVPFLMLCRVFFDRKDGWSESFLVKRQFTRVGNGGYHSECVFVPIREVWAAIYQTFAGMNAA